MSELSRANSDMTPILPLGEACEDGVPRSREGLLPLPRRAGGEGGAHFSPFLGIAHVPEWVYLRAEFGDCMPRPKVDIRQHILDTATRLFTQHGYLGVTMRMLARECHTSMGNLYLYYSSKDELFEEVLHPLIAAIDQLNQQHNSVERISFEAFHDTNVAMLNEIIQFLDEYSDEFYLLLYRSHGSPYEDFLEQYIEGSLRNSEVFMRTLKEKYPQARIEFSAVFLRVRAMESLAFIEMMMKQKVPPGERRRIIEEYIVYSMAGWKALIFPEDTARQ